MDPRTLKLFKRRKPLDSLASVLPHAQSKNQGLAERNWFEPSSHGETGLIKVGSGSNMWFLDQQARNEQ